MTQSTPLKVHITGVYGLVGNLVYRHLSRQPERYEVFGSARRTASSVRIDEAALVRVPDDHFHLADLGDAEAMMKAIDGMDAVLHIAAVPNPDASFEEVRYSNITGTYHVLEAARRAGVRRLVYISSVMTNWGYYQFEEPYRAIREGRTEEIPQPIPLISYRDLTRPTEPYSASKVWAEGFCRTYHDAHAISTVCVRLGYVNKGNKCDQRNLDSVWCSHRDAVKVIERALVATASPRYDIIYGVSDNRYRWVDLDSARALGFEPQDRAEAGEGGAV